MEVHGGERTHARRGPWRPVNGHAARPRRTSGDGPGTRPGRAAAGRAGMGGVGAPGGQPVPPAPLHAAALACSDGARGPRGPGRARRRRRPAAQLHRHVPRVAARPPGGRRRALRDRHRPPARTRGGRRRRGRPHARGQDPARCRRDRAAHRPERANPGPPGQGGADPGRPDRPGRPGGRLRRPPLPAWVVAGGGRRPAAGRGAGGQRLRLLRPPLPQPDRRAAGGQEQPHPALRLGDAADPAGGQRHLERGRHQQQPGPGVARAARPAPLGGRGGALPTGGELARRGADHGDRRDRRDRGPSPPGRDRRRDRLDAVCDRRPALARRQGAVRRQPRRPRRLPGLPVAGLVPGHPGRAVRPARPARPGADARGRCPRYPLPGPARQELLTAIAN